MDEILKISPPNGARMSGRWAGMHGIPMWIIRPLKLATMTAESPNHTLVPCYIYP